jgi:hypothetical protein
LSKSWVLEKLRSNAERAMQAEPVLDREGHPTGVYKYDGSVANRALELIGKELGMFVERKESGRPGDFATMAKEELNRRLVDLLVARGMDPQEAKDFIAGERLRRRQGPRPGGGEQGSRPN